MNRLEAASRISKAETNLTEKLLDDGIKSYKQQKFEEAISKWEEVLARNPAKLEAKFFIEIAKDRIKQTQIHEELKVIAYSEEVNEKGSFLLLSMSRLKPYKITF